MALITCPECKKKISEIANSCPNCGYILSNGEAAKLKGRDKNTRIVSSIIIIIGVIILFKLCTGGNSSDSQIPWDKADNSVKAWVFTQMYVEQNLKSPGSAKFPLDYREYVQKNGTTYTVNSYVDSQNSFGAMIRTHFSATVKETDEDNWEMISFKFYE